MYWIAGVHASKRFPIALMSGNFILFKTGGWDKFEHAVAYSLGIAFLAQ